MPRGDKRQQIMAAAEKLFTSRRFHEIKMDDVARAAGVGKGTIYQYFEDKDVLFFEVATAGFEDMCSVINNSRTSGETFRDQLIKTSRELHTFFLKRHALFSLMQSEDMRMKWCKGPIRDRWMNQKERLDAAVAGIMQKGVNEGNVRADIPPKMLSNLFLNMMRSFGRESQNHGVEHLGLLVDFFCAGASCPKEKKK